MQMISLKCKLALDTENTFAMREKITYCSGSEQVKVDFYQTIL